jgi:hypothetical protein
MDEECRVVRPKYARHTGRPAEGRGAQQGDYREYHADEEQLADFDPHIESEEGKVDVRLRQAFRTG